jgi:hypothetical protein
MFPKPDFQRISILAINMWPRAELAMHLPRKLKMTCTVGSFRRLPEGLTHRFPSLEATAPA